MSLQTLQLGLDITAQTSVSPETKSSRLQHLQSQLHTLESSLRSPATPNTSTQWLSSYSDEGLYDVVGAISGHSAVGFGVDLASPRRIQQAHARFRNHFMARILTQNEQEVLKIQENPELFLTQIWALKEAVFKSIPESKHLYWQQIECLPQGKIFSIQLTDALKILAERHGIKALWSELREVFGLTLALVLALDRDGPVSVQVHSWAGARDE